MSMFDKIFGKIRTKISLLYYGSQARSSPYSGEAWEHDIFRATVDCIASHAAKGRVQHVVLNKQGRIEKTIHNSSYSRLLNVRPNPLMTAYELKYRLVAQLESQTTAIAWIKWGDDVHPEAIYPVDYKTFEVMELKDGGYAISFVDYEGKQQMLLLEDCIVIRKFYHTKLASGDGNAPVYKVLDMSKASDEGFISHLSVSNKVMGIHKNKKAMLDSRDVEQKQQEFAKRIEKAAQNGGIVSIDSTEEYSPLSINTYSANATQMKVISDRIYSYLRTPEVIVQSKYTEQEGMAWYESVIEPIWELMSEAITNACFTKREYDVGNRIIISGGVLMGASYQTRINIIANTKEIGTLTTNEQRELLGYPPVEGGDERQISLNFVKATEQSQYQNGGENNA